MLKELVSAGNYTFLAEIGLVLFVIVFVAVVIRACTQPRREIERLAWMPARDGEVPEEARSEEEQR